MGNILFQVGPHLVLYYSSSNANARVGNQGRCAVNKKLAFKSAEIVSVATGATMGLSILAALPWYLVLTGVSAYVCAGVLVYRILSSVR